MGFALLPMAMRCALVLVLVQLAAPAAADTFGGFSGVDRPYLVNQDRVCAPLAVKAGAATGAPVCEQAAADAITKLSIKNPIVQRGAKASFAATTAGKTLTVTTKTGDVVVTWTAPDPIGKIVDVYASQYEDRVAVAYTSRRLGKEITDVVAFELVKTTGKADPTTTPTTTPTTPTTAPPPEDPKLTKAVDAARKAGKLAGWTAVVALDADHSEARFRIAALAAGAKHPADAIAALEQLANSARADAIEWLVEARFDAAFAAVRADPKFRAAVGLDRSQVSAATTYERAMGFGGQWEQTATCGEKPEVHLTLQRDRGFKLRLKMMCEGGGFDTSKKGTWRLDGDGIVLTVPTKGHKASAKDDAPCKIERAGDEDALHCSLGRDLDFVVLPTRR